MTKQAHYLSDVAVLAISAVMRACLEGRFVHMGGGYYWNDKGGNTLITDFTSGKTQAAGVNQLPADKATNMRMYNGLSNLLCSDGGYGNQRMVYSYHTQYSAKQLLEQAKKDVTVLFPNNGAYTVVYSRARKQVCWIYNLYCEPIVVEHNNEEGHIMVGTTYDTTTYALLIANGREDLAKEFIVGLSL